MYIRTRCTHCKNQDFHEITIPALEHMNFNDQLDVCRYAVENVKVTNSISEEELATIILREIRGYIQNGVSIKKLCRIIKEYYGVASNYCCDLIQRIKLELGMYCPDGGHLYYA